MRDLVEILMTQLLLEGDKLVLAESCTGGLLAAAMTDKPGSSKVFERGFITYSNESKTDLLNVSEEVLRRHGAVSEETAHAMVKGALENSRGTIAISVTGIAGPGGGSDEKPVGLVYIGCGDKDNVTVKKYNIQGDRETIRLQAVGQALRLCNDFIDDRREKT